MTDTIADTLTIIRNAKAVSKPLVSVPFSDLNYRVLKILEEEGFLKKVEKRGRGIAKELRVFLKYDDGVSTITDLNRISTPGKRIYRSAKELRPVRQGYGLSIMSTSQGLMTGKEAKKKNLGGEIICEVW